MRAGPAPGMMLAVARDLRDQLIVQVQTGVVDDDEDLLAELEDAVGALIEELELGEFEEGLLDDDLMRVTAVIYSNRWSEAVDAVTDLLVDLDLADFSAIAHRDLSGSGGAKVIWPPS
jgi:hypothetical protein